MIDPWRDPRGDLYPFPPTEPCANCDEPLADHVERGVVLRPGGPSVRRKLCRTVPGLYEPKKDD